MTKNLLLLSCGKYPNKKETPYLEYAASLLREHYDASPENRKKIIFFGFAALQENWDNYAETARQALAPLGIDIIPAHNCPDPAAVLREADGVFVGGGNTFRLLDELQRRGWIEPIREAVENGMPYGGESAGANVAGPNIMTTNDPLSRRNIESFDSFGIMPFLVNAHYKPGETFVRDGDEFVATGLPTREQRITSFHAEPESTEPVLALYEGTGITIRNNEVRLVGDLPVTLYRKGQEKVELVDGGILSEIVAETEANRPTAQKKPPVRAIASRGNLIRKVGEEAAAVQAKYGFEEIPLLHLGNPGTDQEPDLIHATTQSLRTRTAGYAPHPGEMADREVLAQFFNDIDGAGSGYFTANDVAFSPGATSITAILQGALTNQGDVTLISAPGYGTYYTQTEIFGGKPVGYQFDDEGLITYEEIKRKILENSGKVKLININYPHNPTGKTLSEEEAEKVAAVVNRINKEHPDIVFYNDGVYNATVDAEKGYHSFFAHLSEQAKMQTVTGISGAKMTAQGAERVGGFACKNKALMEGFQGILSNLVAGTNIHAEKGFVEELKQLIGSFRPAKHDPQNPRHKIAAFYGERRKIIADAFAEIDEKLDAANIGTVGAKDPGGSMYVYVELAKTVKGKPVPAAVREEVGSDTFETGEHLKKYMLALPKLGYAPVSVCHGEIFKDDPEKMAMRLSCVSRKTYLLKEAVNSIKGALQEVLGINLGAQKAESVETLKERMENEPDRLAEKFLQRMARDAEKTEPLIVAPGSPYTVHPQRIEVVGANHSLPPLPAHRR